MAKQDSDKESNLKEVLIEKKNKNKFSWFGLFLIVLGIIFLLNNFGIIPPDFWTNLWPLLLVLLGLSIIFRKN